MSTTMHGHRVSPADKGHHRVRALHLAGAFVAAAAIVSSAWSPVLSQDVESTPDMEAIVSEVDAAVAEAQSLLDSGRYDALRPERIVADVGDEPTALRDWVGEHTRWVPYLGTLRGAEGVLIDGTGSSLDRSLLLAELLAQAGRPARLARARLSDEVARGIIENEAGRWRAAPRVSPADLSPAELEHRQAIADAAADVSGWVPLTAEGAPTMTTSASEAARDHWWVQSQDGTTWLDLDPLLADTTRPEAEETYAPNSLPRELSHLVTIRVVAERWDRDGLETFMPFEHQYVFGGTPAFETARLSFWPGGPLDLGPVDTLAQAAEEMTHWLPALEVRGETVLGEWFSNQGRLEDAPRLAQTEAMTGGLEALGGIGAEDTPAEQPSELSGVWLEYVVASPGRESRVERRELYDAIGPAARASGVGAPAALATEDARSRGIALLGSTSMLLAPGFVSAPALQQAYLRFVVEGRNAMIGLVLGLEGSDDERVGPALAQTPATDLDLLAMAAARQLWSPSAESAFVGTPAIWTRHDLHDDADPDSGVSAHVDIVANGVDVHPSVPAAEHQRIRIEQGVTDTFVEYQVSGGTARSNTYARFAERDPDGSDWQLLRAGDDIAQLLEFEHRRRWCGPSPRSPRERVLRARGPHAAPR